jgi:hypothetical protein
MTVVSVFIGQPKPGRHDDVMAINDKSRKVLERHGAKNIRILVGAVSAAAYGSVINSSEYDDLEAWGAFYDEVMADDELLTIMHQAMGADTPFLTQSMQYVTEIPLGRTRGPNGKIVATYVSTPVPGRYEAAIAFANQAYDGLERVGARNCRLFTQQASGVQPELLVSTMDFDNMRAYGKALEAFLLDPAGQRVIATTQSSDAPVRAFTSEVYTEALPQ